MAGGPAVGDLAGRLGFAVSVPESWYELELHPALREDAIRRLVEERVRDVAELWPQRGAIQRLLVEQAAQAWDAGASYCAGFSLPTQEGPVTGSLTVSLVDDVLAGAGTTAAERFAAVPRTDDPLAPYAETSVVDVPTAGACPRVQGIEDTPVGGGRLLRHVFMVTAVPLPRDQRTFLITASSPSLPLADALLDLFDAVTGTFRLVPLDSGTTTRSDDVPSV